MTDVNRTIVYKAISEMLDNPDEYGIYPTTKCYDTLEAVLDDLTARLAAAEAELQAWRATFPIMHVRPGAFFASTKLDLDEAKGGRDE